MNSIFCYRILEILVDLDYKYLYCQKVEVAAIPLWIELTKQHLKFHKHVLAFAYAILSAMGVIQLWQYLSRIMIIVMELVQ